MSKHSEVALLTSRVPPASDSSSTGPPAGADARARSEGQSFSSNYEDWSEYELARILHSLRLIAQDAGDRPVVLVSAGVGLAPLVSMLHCMVADARGPRPQRWPRIQATPSRGYSASRAPRAAGTAATVTASAGARAPPRSMSRTAASTAGSRAASGGRDQQP